MYEIKNELMLHHQYNGKRNRNSWLVVQIQGIDLFISGIWIISQDWVELIQYKFMQFNSFINMASTIVNLSL